MDPLSPGEAQSYLRDFDDDAPVKARASSSTFFTGPHVKRQLKRNQRLDAFFRALTFVAALGILLLLGAVLVTLFQGAMPAIKAFGWHFFSSAHWDPVANQFGALASIYGTLATSFIALLIAVPVSLGIALFLTEISPRLHKSPLGIAIELLAAVPSVIYGMWGLFIFAPFLAQTLEPWMNKHLGGLPLVGPFFSGPTMGIGILPASLILAIMVVPFISAIMRDVFNLVPPMLKESAYGLGATKWEVVWNVVLPESRLGVLAGVMLGLGRALGETMAVTFVIGNSHDLSVSLLAPGSTISSTLANEFTEAVGTLYTASLIELGLILFLITFVVLAIAKFMMMRLETAPGGGKA